LATPDRLIIVANRDLHSAGVEIGIVSKQYPLRREAVTSTHRAALGPAMRQPLVAILALGLLVGAACGAYRFPGGPAAGSGVVSGQVQVVPCGPGPVEPAAGQDILPCKSKPGSGVEIVFSSEGESASTRTDSSGRYSIELDAGTYKVSVKGYMRIISGPNPLTVKAGDSIVADYVVDSGIRTLQ